MTKKKRTETEKRVRQRRRILQEKGVYLGYVYKDLG